MIPSNKRFVIIRFRQIKAAKIQATLDNISYNENVGLSPMISSNDLLAGAAGRVGIK